MPLPPLPAHHKAKMFSYLKHENIEINSPIIHTYIIFTLLCVRVFAVNHWPLAPQTGSFPQNFTDLLSADPEPAQRIQNLGQLHKPWSAHCACGVHWISANNLTFSVWQGG